MIKPTIEGGLPITHIVPISIGKKISQVSVGSIGVGSA
jgi:hypothetical protein